MSEVRNGEKKEHTFLYSEIFYGSQKRVNIFVLLEVRFMVWSNEMNPSSIWQQINWSNQLVIVFFVHFWMFRSLYDLEAIPTKSVGHETFFVGCDTVLRD